MIEILCGFITDVRNCTDPFFKEAQKYELDQNYWEPAVSMVNQIGAKYPLTLASIQCRQVESPIIAICYPMIANPRVKTHGCYKANPMNGVKTKNHNLPNFLIRF